MNVRLGRPLDVISERPLDDRLGTPQDGQIDVNIGGTGLTNINFASISNQVKFIDTMKCFLTSLGQLASTLDDVEKNALKN